MMDDIWQCRHSREGCDSDEACAARDHVPAYERAIKEFDLLELGPYGYCTSCKVIHRYPIEIGTSCVDEAYERDMARVSPWNEGME